MARSFITSQLNRNQGIYFDSAEQAPQKARDGSPLPRAEITFDGKGGSLAALYLPKDTSPDALKTQLSRIPGARIRATAIQMLPESWEADGQRHHTTRAYTVLSVTSPDAPHRFLTQLNQQTGTSLTPAASQHGVDIIQARGWLGMLANVLLIRSGSKTHDPAKTAGSVLAFAYNALGILLGTQKPTDPKALSRIEAEVDHTLPNLPSAEAITPLPEPALEGLRQTARERSIFLSDFLRVGATGLFMAGGLIRQKAADIVRGTLLIIGAGFSLAGSSLNEGKRRDIREAIESLTTPSEPKAEGEITSTPVKNLGQRMHYGYIGKFVEMFKSIPEIRRQNPDISFADILRYRSIEIATLMDIASIGALFAGTINKDPKTGVIHADIPNFASATSLLASRQIVIMGESSTNSFNLDATLRHLAHKLSPIQDHTLMEHAIHQTAAAIHAQAQHYTPLLHWRLPDIELKLSGMVVQQQAAHTATPSVQ